MSPERFPPPTRSGLRLFWQYLSEIIILFDVGTEIGGTGSSCVTAMAPPMRYED
jgi:hypothetical protein